MTVFPQMTLNILAHHPQEVEKAPDRKHRFREIHDPNVVCHGCSTDRKRFPGRFWTQRVGEKVYPLCERCYRYHKYCF